MKKLIAFFMLIAVGLSAQTRRTFKVDDAYYIDFETEVLFKSVADSIWFVDASSQTPKVILENTNADGFSPLLQFIKNSASPTSGDDLGQLIFYGDDDGGNKTSFMTMRVESQTVTDGSEAGKFEIDLLSAFGGGGTNFLTMQGHHVLPGFAEVAWNEDSQDIDHRIESTNDTHAFFLEGLTGDVALGASAPVGQFHVSGDSVHIASTTASRPIQRMVNTNTDNAGAVLQFEKISTGSAADSDVIGNVRFFGYDDGDNATHYAQIQAFSGDVTGGTESGILSMGVAKNGSDPFSSMFALVGEDSSVVINDASEDVNTRIESDNDANAIFVQGSSGNVGFGLEPTANMAGISIEDGLLTLKERATPTADANYGKIYTKTDNMLYFQDGAGAEHSVNISGASYVAIGFVDSSETLTMTQNVYAKVTNATNNLYSTSVSNDFTVAGDTLAPTVTGDYKISWDLSFSGSNSDNFHIALFVNNSEVGFGEANRDMSTSNVGVAAASTIVNITAGQYISLRIKNTANANDATITHGNIVVEKK